jgi:hypothetical protein
LPNSACRKIAALLACSGFLCGGARAGELDAFDGRLESNNSGSKTYTWGIEYRQPLSDHFSGSFVWLNEGHLPNNHRDGQAVQLWWHTTPDPRGLMFETGLGPYRYYDTHALMPDPDFHDAHGWGAIASASMVWYFADRWFTFLRANEVSASDKYSSTSLAVGIGYRFSKAAPGDAGEAPDEAAGRDTAPRWEIDALVGERVGNTTHSETGLSEAIAARFKITEHFSASLTNILGQNTLLGWRDGFAAQLWLEQRLTPRLSVGAGAGAFVVSSDDAVRDAAAPANLAAMVSVTVAYSFSTHWLARVVWDRIGTGDDHDADILHFGAGYKF